MLWKSTSRFLVSLMALATLIPGVSMRHAEAALEHERRFFIIIGDELWVTMCPDKQVVDRKNCFDNIPVQERTSYKLDDIEAGLDEIWTSRRKMLEENSADPSYNLILRINMFEDSIQPKLIDYMRNQGITYLSEILTQLDREFLTDYFFAVVNSAKPLSRAVSKEVTRAKQEAELRVDGLLPSENAVVTHYSFGMVDGEYVLTLMGLKRPGYKVGLHYVTARDGLPAQPRNPSNAIRQFSHSFRCRNCPQPKGSETFTISQKVDTAWRRDIENYLYLKLENSDVLFISNTTESKAPVMKAISQRDIVESKQYPIARASYVTQDGKRMIFKDKNEALRWARELGVNEVIHDPEGTLSVYPPSLDKVEAAMSRLEISMDKLTDAVEKRYGVPKSHVNTSYVSATSQSEQIVRRDELFPDQDVRVDQYSLICYEDRCELTLVGIRRPQTIISLAEEKRDKYPTYQLYGQGLVNPPSGTENFRISFRVEVGPGSIYLKLRKGQPFLLGQTTGLKELGR